MFITFTRYSVAMAHPTQTHLPEDGYLSLVGQMAYMTTSLEGLIIFDLNGLSTYLPIELTASALAGKTTRTIGTFIQTHLESVTDPDVELYLANGANALIEVSEYRNDLLHARPATTEDGKTRLNRWTAGNPQNPQKAFWISSDWLVEKIERISQLQQELNDVRPLHRHASFPEHSPK